MACTQRAIAAAAVVFLTTGCLGIGGGDEYAKYQDREGAFAQIDVLLAGVPQYPGARVADIHESATRYAVGVDEVIEAEPYTSTVGYLVPQPATGGRVMLHFRRMLPTRGWKCSFAAPARDEERRIACRRGHESLEAVISDRGHYELIVQASDVRPPIEVIGGP